LAKRCEGMSVIISGHADGTGSEETNQALSDERAEAVRAALVERGVDSKLLETLSFGARQPADDVTGKRSHTRDRRVEFAAGQHRNTPAAP
jgi:OOP family OmpA-OmpF porin